MLSKVLGVWGAIDDGLSVLAPMKGDLVNYDTREQNGVFNLSLIEGALSNGYSSDQIIDGIQSGSDLNDPETVINLRSGGNAGSDRTGSGAQLVSSSSTWGDGLHSSSYGDIDAGGAAATSKYSPYLQMGGRLA